MKVSLHCNISESAKRKILAYGKGNITLGIENLVKLAESKRIVVVIETNVSID